MTNCLRRKGGWIGWAACLLTLLAFPAAAAIQFDVFLGYDGWVPEASWFPIVCEVKNDGPTFTATVELDNGNYGQGQTRQLVLELPTGTLKRFVIPVFAPARYNRWDVRLLDEKGKVRAEQTNLQPRRSLAQEALLLGAIPRSAGGTPQIRPILAKDQALQPAVARLLPTILPDNPLVLESLNGIYLNSEQAANLSLSQVNALFAWLNAGGHLIVAVEQPADITTSPWLKDLVPCVPKELRTLDHHPELQDWLRGATWSTNVSLSTGSPQPNPFTGHPPRSNPSANVAVSNPFPDLANDFDFETAPLQVAVGQVKEGTIEAAAGDTPLIVSAARGKGRVTVLLFSPEREPVRSWKNLPTFWAKILDVPGAWYASSDFNLQGGWSSDGIFGALIDTRQIHKLPVQWLLLLLVIYLVVIGPLDQMWLKRLGKPMLTWITFPCYVVVFSLVIYLIGYKLRAGESEWNELHIVDVLSNGERAELRGRTYSSVYSPSNQKYLLDGKQKYATLRGELVGMWGANQSSEKATVVQNGDGYKAEIFVPVWTSQLFISDWWEPASMPLSLSVHAQGDGWRVDAHNRTDKALSHVQIALAGRIISLGELRAGEAKTFSVAKEQGSLLSSFAEQFGSGFASVIQSRQHAFGESASGRLTDLPNSAMAACFLSQLPHQGQTFLAPPGLDLSPFLGQGGAVLLAWAEDFSPVEKNYHFSPRRSAHYTLWRVPVPIE